MISTKDKTFSDTRLYGSAPISPEMFMNQKMIEKRRKIRIQRILRPLTAVMPDGSVRRFKI